MTTLSAANARFETNRLDARRKAALTLVPVLGVEFHAAGWSGKAKEAYEQQWCAVKRHATAACWDWIEVFRRHKDPDRFDLAIWAGDRLSALALGTTTQQAVVIKFVEGDPRPDCPLVGRRLLIVLECMANYAQGRGKSELRMEPANSDLATLYRDTFGFSLETFGGRSAYYGKAV
jgi:hypothetical protein